MPKKDAKLVQTKNRTTTVTAIDNDQPITANENLPASRSDTGTTNASIEFHTLAGVIRLDVRPNETYQQAFARYGNMDPNLVSITMDGDKVCAITTTQDNEDLQSVTAQRDWYRIQLQNLQTQLDKTDAAKKVPVAEIVGQTRLQNRFKPNLPSGPPSSLPSASVAKTRSKQHFSLLSHELLLHARMVFNAALEVPVAELSADEVSTNLRSNIFSGIYPGESNLGIFKPYSDADFIPEEHRTSYLSMDLFHALLRYFTFPTPTIQILDSLDQQLQQRGFEFISHKLSSVHQVPVGRGTVDVLLSYDVSLASESTFSAALRNPRQSLPLVSIEFTREGIAKKFNQAYAYATHTLDLHNYSVPILSIRMSNLEFSVDVFYVEFEPTESDHQFICISLVPTQPITNQSLHALLTLIVFWFRTFEPLHMQNNRLNFIPKSNVLEFEGFIYKRINTRTEKSIDLNERFIPGVERLFRDKFVHYVRYPKIEGTHNPTSLLHLKSLIDEVVKLHQNKPSIVHGDIRFANIIFSTVSHRASLIDFDMSGQAGKKVYPMNFATDISPDGVRHPDAFRMKPLQVVHDCFAVLALLLKLVDCVPKGIRHEYCAAVSIKSYDDDSLQRVGAALEALHLKNSTNLTLLPDRSANDSGTGSVADTAKHRGSPGTEAAIADATANAVAAASSSRTKRSSGVAFGRLSPKQDNEQLSGSGSCVGSGSDKTSNSVSSRATLKSRKLNQSTAVPLLRSASSRAKVGFLTPVKK